MQSNYQFFSDHPKNKGLYKLHPLGWSALCFFDFNRTRLRKRYETIVDGIARDIEQARTEIAGGSYGSGVKRLIRFADKLGDFCLASAQARAA